MPWLIHVIICGWRCIEFHDCMSLVQDVFPEDNVNAKCYTIWVLGPILQDYSTVWCSCGTGRRILQCCLKASYLKELLIARKI